MKAAILSAIAFGAALAWACGGSTSDDSAGGSGGNTGGAGGSGGSSGGAGGSGNASGTGGATGGTGGSGNVSGAGGSSNYTACSSPGTCVLFPNNCCGYCGDFEPISSYQPVNVAHLSELKAQLCADPQACPDCVSYDDPNYLALCRSGQCTAVDLLVDSLSACQTDTDCRLRWGSGCCENCGGTPAQLVTYNKNQNLEAEVCDPASGACPPCVPPEYPAGILAICSEGHCKTTPVGP